MAVETLIKTTLKCNVLGVTCLTSMLCKSTREPMRPGPMKQHPHGICALVGPNIAELDQYERRKYTLPKVYTVSYQQKPTCTRVGHHLNE